MHKLSDEDVIEIRRLRAEDKIKLKILAKKYSTSIRTISHIVHGESHALVGGTITRPRYTTSQNPEKKNRFIEQYNAMTTVKDTRLLVRKKSFEVFYVDDPQQFHTPSDDGSRVDMMTHDFKPGWFWWPKRSNAIEPLDDPVGPFDTEEMANQDAVGSPHWGEWLK